MQRSEIDEFLQKIDEHIARNFAERLAEKKFGFQILGKSALLLAGLEDSLGTVDIDLLRVEGRTVSTLDEDIIKSLETEFGRSRVKVHGYYLDFVGSSFVFLSQKPVWVPFGFGYRHLAVSYLEAHDVVASKLFSAFSDVPRKRDKQDIVAALDQGLVEFKKVCRIADQIFDFHSMDSRSDRFPEVHEYIRSLMEDYGQVELEFRPS